MKLSVDIYQNWKILNWETPVSQFSSPRLELLMDASCLSIIIQDGAGERRARVRFIFGNDYAYRNINESFRNELWAKMPTNLGQTLIVEDSDFLNLLRSDNIGEETFSKAKHYLFKTEDDVIEVVATQNPEIQMLTDAEENSPAVGKSKILFK
jgi:hypothetical protein